MYDKKFQRKKENFICRVCGQKVEGNGYTDHCPICLWSKHLDLNPGDRRSVCGGLMRPVGMEIKSGDYTINYRCRNCGHLFRVKAAADDNFEEILRLAKEYADS